MYFYAKKMISKKTPPGIPIQALRFLKVQAIRSLFTSQKKELFRRLQTKNARQSLQVELRIRPIFSSMASLPIFPFFLKFRQQFSWTLRIFPLCLKNALVPCSTVTFVQKALYGVGFQISSWCF